MMNLRMTVTAAVAGGLLWAQGATAQVQEEAKKVLQQSADALLKIQSVEYTARRFGEGNLKIIDFTGDLKLIRSATDKTRCPMLLRGHSKSLGPKDDPFWYSLDGNGKMTVVDEDNKIVYIDRPLDGPRITPMNQRSAGEQILLDVYFMTEPYKNEVTAETITLEPRQDFKGDTCDVVKTTRPLRGGTGKSTVLWYIATTDRLPRRQEQIVSMGDEPIKMVFEVWDVKPNTGLKAGDLKVDAPKDFKPDVFVAPPPPEPQPQQPPPAPPEPVKPPVLGVEAGNLPPDFSLKATDGKTVKRDDLAGSPTVLAFLWSKNAPSARSIPVVEELKAKYKDNHLKVYAVLSHEKNDTDGPKFLTDNKATFPALLGGDDALNKAYKLAAFPSFYVIGADGKVVGFVQNSDAEAIKKGLTDLLQSAIEGSASAAK